MKTFVADFEETSSDLQSWKHKFHPSHLLLPASWSFRAVLLLVIIYAIFGFSALFSSILLTGKVIFSRLSEFIIIHDMYDVCHCWSFVNQSGEIIEIHFLVKYVGKYLTGNMEDKVPHWRCVKPELNLGPQLNIRWLLWWMLGWELPLTWWLYCL